MKASLQVSFSSLIFSITSQENMSQNLSLVYLRTTFLWVHWAEFFLARTAESLRWPLQGCPSSPLFPRVLQTLSNNQTHPLPDPRLCAHRTQS